jgi:hypothetical protein
MPFSLTCPGCFGECDIDCLTHGLDAVAESVDCRDDAMLLVEHDCVWESAVTECRAQLATSFRQRVAYAAE